MGKASNRAMRDREFVEAHPEQPEKQPAIALEAIFHQTFQERP